MEEKTDYIKNGVLTLEQKKEFCEYALKIFEEGFGAGFCSVFSIYFNTLSIGNNDLRLIPELYKYKPILFYYTWGGKITFNKYMFWFPQRNKKKRIKILKKVLKELEKQESLR